MPRRLAANVIRAFGYAIKAYPGLIAALILLALAQAALPYVTSSYLGELVNQLVEIAGGGATGALWGALAIYVGVRLARPVVQALWNYADQIFFLRFQMKIELMVLERRSAFDVARYEDSSFLNKMQRAFQRDYWPIVNLVDRVIGTIEPLAATVIGIVIAYAFDWRAFAVLVIFSIPSFIANFKYGKHVWGIWDEGSEDSRRIGDLRGHITQRFDVVELKMFQGTRKFLDWIARILAGFNDRQRSAELKKARDVIITELLGAIGAGIAIIMIVRSAVSGETDIGTMTFLIASIAVIQDSVVDFFTRLARILDDNQYASDIFDILDTKPIVVERDDALVFKPERPPEIKFEDVSFRYEGQEKYVLRHVNLTIPSGAKMGLVGNNGAGKTTLIRLLCRVYDPTEGRITIDGIDLRDFKIEDWRRSLGVLFQDFSSYDFLAKDAIAMGRPDETTDIDRVRHAAAVSESKEFVERWENKYDQQIGVEFGGIDPSKGQKQKLALSRVLYRDPVILVLDEPTAAVDAESEAKIFERIENLSKSVTALLISHRFSTVKRADTIVVMEHGAVVEQGSHDELMAKQGRYAELFTTQLEGYTK
jgi:ATP-binding cassette subfamily B protein